jgi:hypothetical protein
MPTAEDDGLGRTKCMGRKVDDGEERRIGVDEGEGNQLKRMNEFGANQTEDTRWLEVSQPVVFGLPEARKGRGMLELVPTAGEVTGIRSESTRRQGSGQCATAKPGGA